MNSPKLTIKQKQFLERFDRYTDHGAKPKQTRNLRSEWRIQDRTINKCYRLGFLKKIEAATGESFFIVDPQKRPELGLMTQVMGNRRIRKRSSANITNF